MRRKTVLILVSIVLVAGLIGCAGVTPKKTSATFFATYNAQYELYKAQVQANPTDAQKQVLREKKKILIKVYPLIQTFDLAIVEGKPVDPALQAQILNLLGQLGGAK